MFGRNILILKTRSFIESSRHHIVQRLAQILLRDCRHLRQSLHLPFHFLRQNLRRHAQLRQQRRHHPIALRHQRPQQMQRLDLLLSRARAHFLRRLQRFLSLYG